MEIKYTSSVYTAAGWRSVTIRADAERISAGMARVQSVIDIDGESPVGTLSRTGANRQKYFAGGIAQREIGARKRLHTVMARHETLDAYIQSDPRGAALYILRPGDVPEGKDVNGFYSRGICVY